MANNAQNVSVGKPKVGGAIYRAPLDTVLPVSAKEALDEAFACLGFCSDSGLTNNNSAESEDIKAWGGDIVLSVQTEKQDTFNFELLEVFNTDVLKTVYGDENVSGDLKNGIKIVANSEEQEEFAWVIDMTLRGGVMKRIVIPDGKITNVDEISYTDNEAIGYNTTLSALPDSSEKQATHYEYIQAPVTYTATFETNGGSTVKTQTVKEGGTAKEPNAPTKNGYAFDGWYSDEELTEEYDFQTVLTEDITLYAKWEVAIFNPSVAAEAAATTLFGTAVRDIQSNIRINNGKITGTLKYLSSGEIVDAWGAGNFIALKFTDIDSRATSVMVGLDPSQGSGLVELIDDPDKNGVFKVTDKNAQVFKVVSSDGTNTTTTTYDLSGLTIKEA
ncbi:MAG: InlB B-repeat-containing protein [Lachnospiraceae bacterium]|nr:InlB B-repeat-containing protein [Lachnospiraceae bacterium]